MQIQSRNETHVKIFMPLYQILSLFCQAKKEVPHAFFIISNLTLTVFLKPTKMSSTLFISVFAFLPILHCYARVFIFSQPRLTVRLCDHDGGPRWAINARAFI